MIEDTETSSDSQVLARPAWTIRQLIMGKDVKPEHVETLSPPYKAIVERMAAERNFDRRDSLLEGWKIGRPEWPALASAIDATDGFGSCPDATPSRRWADLSSIRRVVSVGQWTWPAWIPSASIFALAAFEGVGKSRFCLDLHRRVFLGLPWPDGQSPSIESGRPAVWLASDQQHGELLDTATAFGLPDESIWFPALDPDPREGTDLDDESTLSNLDALIRDRRPWIVFIDSLTYATALKMHDPSDVKKLQSFLSPLAQTYGIPICLVVHMSKEGQALGRRVRGISRTVVHVSRPDEGIDRLKLWVEKSFGVKPPPLGVTMGECGNEYDHSPPSAPDSSFTRKGPSPAKLDACIEWLRDRLTTPQRVVDLRKSAADSGVIPSQESAGLLYRSMEKIGVEEFELDRKKWWRLPADSTLPDVAEASDEDETTPPY